MAFCVRCGTELNGPYCAQCGTPADRPYPGGTPGLDDGPTLAVAAPAPMARPKSRRRRVAIIGTVLVALIAAAVPAAMAYQDRRQRQQRESEFVTKTQRALIKTELVTEPMPDTLLLSVGYDMCEIYANGGDLGDAMDAYSTEATAGPAHETVEEFIDRIAEPLSQLMGAGVIAAGAAANLCPEHYDVLGKDK